MTLESGRLYRAKTVLGTQITFIVMEAGEEIWAQVQLDEAGVVEPNVWLNTALLLWISSEPRRTDAISKATAEVIEALEDSVEVPMPSVARELV
jgi:hypothetical protein